MFRLILAVLFLMSTNAFATTQWKSSSLPLAGDSKSAWPVAVNAQWSILDTLVANYRKGMTLIYKSATTITVSSGEVTASSGGVAPRLFLQNTGNTDITSANLDAGGSFSGSTTYYVYAYQNSNTATTASFFISLSSSAPAGATYYKLLGNFITDSSGNVINGQIFDEPYGNQKADANGRPLIIAKILDYGTSSSSSTTRYPGQLMVAYGQSNGSIGGGGNLTVTNLPFTSNSSYACQASINTNGTGGRDAIAVTNNSASSMSVTNPSSNSAYVVNWFCIGI